VFPEDGRAQQQQALIGHLNTRLPEDAGHLVQAFRNGLAQNGYVEGRNLRIEYRWAFGEYDRLPALAAELVAQGVAVLVASGGEPAALAAAGATNIIPIVFLVGSDPVTLGLVASYNRPGRNITGVTLLTASLEPKRFGLLRELVPGATTFGVLINPKFPPSTGQLQDIDAAARAAGVQIQVFRASDEQQLEAAFEAISQQRISALAACADPFFDTRREKIVRLAARAAVPTMYHFREYVAVGGLMSYGIDNVDAYRQTGVSAAQILNGANAAELPVMQENKFLLIINLRTAKSLGIRISDNLLSLADEAIE
jgi:putative ABC transport system substrate-binding protein